MANLPKYDYVSIGFQANVVSDWVDIDVLNSVGGVITSTRFGTMAHACGNMPQCLEQKTPIVVPSNASILHFTGYGLGCAAHIGERPLISVFEFYVC